MTPRQRRRSLINIERMHALMNQTDAQRAQTQAPRYARFIKAYMAMKANPGLWIYISDWAQGQGISARTARRMIQTFAVMEIPGIEVQLEPKGGGHRGACMRGI